ncbi:hypothetical protein H5410_040534 [Solanum commersonii]|uniref:Putative plant transposon protein domain-containing protein n=1 Tax=Solanum commersonii TaxID=4109 RepID=A0A9J5XRQ0_SOLCO|nr:hypothetical protein H5410_040534 [Solanum commersonii]
MWRVPSGVEKEKLPSPLVAENWYKNLAKRLSKGMTGNGSHVNKRWGRSKDTGRHNTLNFANFNQVARVWLKIVCSVLLPAKHLTEVTMDMVALFYMLMKGMPINIGAILRQNMMKFRNNLRWRFCYGGLITHFLRAEGIEEETVDMTVSYHPDLTGKLVDVTRKKALDTSYGPVLSAQERQACDDSVMARIFSMAELQLRIEGQSVTDDEMETLADRYPLIESAAFLCRYGPTFMEPLDDDEVTTDEAMDDEKDDAVDEEGEYGATKGVNSHEVCTGRKEKL